MVAAISTTVAAMTCPVDGRDYSAADQQAQKAIGSWPARGELGTLRQWVRILTRQLRRCRCERYLMTDVKHYLVGEHVEDFNSGLITRRELLRRVTLITGSLASTLVLLEVTGCQREPSGQPPSPASRQASTPQPFATPPAQPTTDGVTVRSDDPRIAVAPMTVTGADGASLISYYARPAGGEPAGGILVSPGVASRVACLTLVVSL
ncbi:MAG: hypothetical protein DLM61_19295 [Pseudonocardiales bacterium]|nr:MAG: hypothetical protein DLM61_19295 [Pseudonocardiales bacterium]